MILGVTPTRGGRSVAVRCRSEMLTTAHSLHTLSPGPSYLWSASHPGLGVWFERGLGQMSRIRIKLSPRPEDAKLIREAAEISGLTLSAFALSAAVQAARRVTNWAPAVTSGDQLGPTGDQRDPPAASSSFSPSDLLSSQKADPERAHARGQGELIGLDSGVDLVVEELLPVWADLEPFCRLQEPEALIRTLVAAHPKAPHREHTGAVHTWWQRKIAEAKTATSRATPPWKNIIRGVSGWWSRAETEAGRGPAAPNGKPRLQAVNRSEQGRLEMRWRDDGDNGAFAGTSLNDWLRARGVQPWKPDR